MPTRDQLARIIAREIAGVAAYGGGDAHAERAADAILAAFPVLAADSPTPPTPPAEAILREFRFPGPDGWVVLTEGEPGHLGTAEFHARLHLPEDQLRYLRDLLDHYEATAEPPSPRADSPTPPTPPDDRGCQDGLTTDGAHHKQSHITRPDHRMWHLEQNTTKASLREPGDSATRKGPTRHE